MKNISSQCLIVCPAPNPLPLASVSLHTDYSFFLPWSFLAWQPNKTHVGSSTIFENSISHLAKAAVNLSLPSSVAGFWFICLPLFSSKNCLSYKWIIMEFVFSLFITTVVLRSKRIYPNSELSNMCSILVTSLRHIINNSTGKLSNTKRGDFPLILTRAPLRRSKVELGNE